MIDLGDRFEDSTINFKFYTHKADGTPITYVSGDAVVYKADGTTESGQGVSVTLNFDGKTGMHHVTIDTSVDTPTAGFYAVGNDYQVMLSAGTVDGVAVTGYIIGQFSIENRFVKGTNNAATASALATMQTDVTAILEDTNITIPATLSTVLANIAIVDGVCDAILVDTNVSLPALLADIQGRLPASLSSTGFMKADVFAVNEVTSVASVLKNALLGTIIANVLNATQNAEWMTTDLTGGNNNWYNGRTGTFITGNLIGQGFKIADFDNATKKITFEDALTSAPTYPSIFVVT